MNTNLEDDLSLGRSGEGSATSRPTTPTDAKDVSSQARVALVTSASAIARHFCEELSAELDHHRCSVDIAVVTDAADCESHVDLVLVDASCAAGQRALMNRYPSGLGKRCVCLVASDARELIEAATAMGVLAFASLDSTIHEIATAVSAALSGSLYCSAAVMPDVLAAISATPHLTGAATVESSCLTRREAEVAELISRGLTNREIGRELVLQPQTVKNYVTRVMRKLGATSRFALIAERTRRLS